MSALSDRRVVLHDMTLRDGMHPKRHQITLEQMVAIAGALDAQVEAACNSALGLIGGFIETLLAGLRWDSNLSLHGSTTLIDDDDTLVVDRMYGGQYFGTVVISGSRSSPFTATFSGARVVE